MSARLWPCDRCGAPGVRNIGTSGYCGTHLGALLDTFSPTAWSFDGIAVPAGLERPEHGAGMADVRCAACAATWVGRVGERCPWCARQRQLMLEAQRAQLLRVPDLDGRPADVVLAAWGQRLRNAVDAGVLERHEAKAAWARAVRRAA